LHYRKTEGNETIENYFARNSLFELKTVTQQKKKENLTKIKKFFKSKILNPEIKIVSDA
jgi:hypothetical protein